jgi:hypothetical protein
MAQAKNLTEKQKKKKKKRKREKVARAVKPLKDKQGSFMEYFNLIKEKFLSLPKKYQIAIAFGVVVVIAVIIG